MKLVFADVAGAADVEPVRQRLPDAEIVVVDDRAALADALRGADAVACHRLAAADLVHAERLRLVQALSAGADAIERDALPRGAVLCVVGGHERAIAEWVLMALLALPRQLLRFDRDLRRGVWHRHGDERLDLGEPELEGQTLCVIGHGQIGREVGRLAAAAGAVVAPVSRSLGNLGELASTLQRSDFAAVCVALTPQTRGLVGARELQALGGRGYLVNVARGAVVDEDALYAALRDGTIAGAALDVWWRYPDEPGDVVPPSARPFHELDNVLMTPHVSGRSRRTTERRRQFVAEQLERFARGEPLRNVVHA
jgi:phosphoglycerate dehydrogenase-like enzyme